MTWELDCTNVRHARRTNPSCDVTPMQLLKDPEFPILYWSAHHGYILILCSLPVMAMEDGLLMSRPSPAKGRYITILCIDGGGIRGIIPGVILGFLESELQKLDGEDACIADYFDVVAGTSTGGLIAAMLTAPNKHNRPLYGGKDIADFYLQHCPKIFPQSRLPKRLASLKKLVKAIRGPAYNSRYLQRLVREKLEDTRLSQTLTNVVIPSFDIKTMQPVIFSNFQAEKHPSLDARLSDISIGTSAAPTFFPAYTFKTCDQGGSVREFNLIDGGVAANNPALIAISEVVKEIRWGNTNFGSIKPTDYDRLLVVSLGTGTAKSEQKYSAEDAAKWGVMGWLLNRGSVPLVNMFTQASQDMVDVHLSTIFQAVSISCGNYLRIQDDTLVKDLASADVATKKNLENLVKFAEGLLKQPVSLVNLDNGISEHAHVRFTLLRMAARLSEEKRIREVNCKTNLGTEHYND